jgi:hypothetical protein
MKKLMSVALGLSLLVPMATFAQATGGSTDKAPKTEGKKATKEKKGHKGGKKGKKGSGGTTTTPPPK